MQIRIILKEKNEITAGTSDFYNRQLHADELFYPGGLNPIELQGGIPEQDAGVLLDDVFCMFGYFGMQVAHRPLRLLYSTLAGQETLRQSRFEINQQQNYFKILYKNIDKYN
jgi:hypothetical protein